MPPHHCQHQIRAQLCLRAFWEVSNTAISHKMQWLPDYWEARYRVWMVHSPALDGGHPGPANPVQWDLDPSLQFTHLPERSAPLVGKGPNWLSTSQQKWESEGKRAEILFRNPRGILKRSSTPTPSLLQPQLSSAQATKPWSLGSPHCYSSLRVPHSQDKKAFLSVGQEEVGPALPSRRGKGFHSHCSHPDCPTMEEGAGGRRALRVCLTCWSGTNWIQPPNWLSVVLSSSSLPSLDFLHPFPSCPFPSPTTSCVFSVQAGDRGTLPQPQGHHLWPAPACLSGSLQLSFWHPIATTKS